MQLNKYKGTYIYDKGLNLIQRNHAGQGYPDLGRFDQLNAAQRMIPCQTSNRAISELLYTALNLSPEEKAHLNQALLDKKVFDRHGNQLKTGTGQFYSWDYSNMLQTTVTDLDENRKLREYNIYSTPGQRSRKVTEITDNNYNIIEIREALYLGNLEYRTTWRGENLSYDGETVTEISTGDIVTPYEKYSSLRIRQWHKQVVCKVRYEYQDRLKVEDVRQTTYSLDNNIDSCELTLDEVGNIKNYNTFRPYGETCNSFGNTVDKPYKYSGQEEDESKLYYYGFRSYLPANFRWISTDPAGLQGSGLNLFAMVGGNPISHRDHFGLTLWSAFNEMQRKDRHVFDNINKLVIGYFRQRVSETLVNKVNIDIVKYTSQSLVSDTRFYFNDQHYINILVKNDVTISTPSYHAARKHLVGQMYIPQQMPGIMVDQIIINDNEEDFSFGVSSISRIQKGYNFNPQPMSKRGLVVIADGSSHYTQNDMSALFNMVFYSEHGEQTPDEFAHSQDLMVDKHKAKVLASYRHKELIKRNEKFQHMYGMSPYNVKKADISRTLMGNLIALQAKNFSHHKTMEVGIATLQKGTKNWMEPSITLQAGLYILDSIGKHYDVVDCRLCRGSKLMTSKPKKTGKPIYQPDYLKEI